MARLVRSALATVAPFIVIAGTFAAALVHHLGEPARAAARFEATLAARAAPPAGIGDDDFVALERTACFGACPVYRVRVDGAGRVEFSGRSGVCQPHPSPVDIGRADARRLIGALREAGFAALPRSLGMRSDLRDKVVELRVGELRHRVYDNGAPPADTPLLEAAARAIDASAGTARWLPRARPGATPYCELPDGRKAVFATGSARLVPEDEAPSTPGR